MTVTAAAQRGANLTRGLSLAAAVCAIDQVSKWWIVEFVMSPPRTLEVLPFFNLVLAHNRGVSFGLFGSDSPWGRWLLVGLAVIIIIALVVWLCRARRWWVVMALGLIIGGAVGNVIDRMWIGAVVDFLDVHAFGYHWPAFNAADSAITAGAVILIVDSFLSPDETDGDSPETVDSERSST